MTSPAGGGQGQVEPHTHAQRPAARLSVPSLQPVARRDFLFLCGAPGFARRRRSAGDSETRSLGEGRRRHSRRPGAVGGQAMSGSRQVPSCPRPTRAGTRLRCPRPPPTRRRSTPPRPRGWHPGRHPPRAASTRALPHAGRPLPGPHPPRPPATPGAASGPAPTRGAAVRAARVRRPLQQLQHGLPPLLGHGRVAAPRDAGWGASAPPR